MNTIVNLVIQDIIKNSDEKTRISGERFFKENVKIHGLKAASIEKIGKEFFRKIKDYSKAEIFGLCEELWQSGYIEEAAIACNWSYYVKKLYEPEDLLLFEKWVDNYVTNWATCDTLCNHSVGSLIEMCPGKTDDLKRWAKSNNRWMRRASAVSFIVPARRGLFLKEIFEIAGILLNDKEDMVQKGYGWMLKSASQAHQKEVFEYVMRHKSVMPRTALRYAIEKMPMELKARAMAK